MAYEIVKSAEFCGIECDFYSNENNEIFMTSFQLGSCLGYSNPQKAVDNLISRNEYLKNIEFSVTLKMRATDGKQYDTRLFTEDGIYEVTMLAKTEKAKDFRTFVREVVKSIRKHGAYMTPETIEKALTSPDFLIQLATKLKEEKEKNIQLSAKIEQDKPKVEYHDSVINTGNLITMTNIAKDLGFRSAQPLNKILVGNKIIFPKKNKDGKIKGYEVMADYNWLITEKYADYRIFDEKSSVPALRFTEKGREWIVNNITNHKWKIN